MPIWLRKFTKSQIQDNFNEQEKQHKEAMERRKNKGKKSLVDSEGKVNVPAFKEASKPYKGKTSYK